MGSFTLINIYCMQILYTNCIDGGNTYTVELTPTYSSPTLNISNTTKFGETLLTLLSDKVKLNEMYKGTVRIEGFPAFQQHVTFSKFEIPATILILIYFCRYI